MTEQTDSLFFRISVAGKSPRGNPRDRQHQLRRFCAQLEPLADKPFPLRVSPAFVQVAYDSPRTVSRFRVFLSYGTSYQWWVEKADTQSDMDTRSGSWMLLTPTNTVASWAWGAYVLPTPVTAHLFKLSVRRFGGDNYCHLNEWELYGDAVIDALQALMGKKTGVIVTRDLEVKPDVVCHTTGSRLKDVQGQLKELLTRQQRLKTELRSLGESTTSGTSTITESLREAKNLKAGVHYGCHFLKPSNIKKIDDAERPHVFDDIVEAAGMTSVPYKDKGMCCGREIRFRAGLSSARAEAKRRKVPPVPHPFRVLIDTQPPSR